MNETKTSVNERSKKNRKKKDKELIYRKYKRKSKMSKIWRQSNLN